MVCCLSFLGPYTGVDEGKLHGCGLAPNCVSSESWTYNYIFKVSPYQYSESKPEAFQKLLKYFREKENVYVAEVRDNEYLRLIYFTKVFRFPDKVEFFFDSDSKVQVRSQSVFGFWDIFANRIRVRSIRKEMGWEEVE